MCQELHRWDAAIAISESKNRPDTEELKTSYLQWLLETGQEEKAAVIKEKEGDIETAIQLYMQGGLPAKAAALAQNPNYQGVSDEMLKEITGALSKSGLHEKAGSFFEKLGMAERALDSYRKGHAYRRAVELARKMFPREVVSLEDAWGNWLVEQKQLDAAINHFIEAGQYVKAIEAAIQARQWSKAGQIVDQQDDDVAEKYYKVIGAHFDETKHYEKAERFYIKARCPQAAVDMYTRANKWDKAHKLASTYMSEQAVSTHYCNQAQRLEASGKLKDAEKLYIMVNEPDYAINMYKKHRHYDQMIRLVGKYRPDLLAETHLHLAQQLEADNKFKDAERHYIDANEWKSAVNMYRSHDLWDDAIRVAKGHGGVNASKQVAYAWAVHLGGEAGAKLLTKFGLIEQAIDYATESGKFDQAFELARTSLKAKLPEVHLKKAMYLEDEGNFKEAEVEFINAKKPKEAIDMYVHQQDWASALRIADNYDTASRAEIRAAQARALMDKRDWRAAEDVWIELRQFEKAVKMYKDARMWEDALRVAKTHENAPGIGSAMVYQLQQEKARGLAAPDPGGDKDLMAEGKFQEDSGNYTKAIDAYLKVTSAHTSDVEYLEEIWEKAVELAMTQCAGRITEVVSTVSKRLVELGRFEPAAEFYEGIDAHQEAIDVYIRAGLWDKARGVATNDAQLASYVEQQFAARGSAGGMGRGGGLTIYGPTGGSPKGGMGGGGGGKGDGLQELASRRDWSRCLEVAQGMGKEGLDEYIKLHTMVLLEQGDAEEAVHVFYKHGSPASNLAVYKQVAKEVLGRNRSHTALPGTWLPAVTELREVLYKLWAAISNEPGIDAKDMEEISALLHCTHYLCLHNAVKGKGGTLAELEQKLATSLLRYCDILPADMVFHEAAQACKAVNKLNQVLRLPTQCLCLSVSVSVSVSVFARCICEKEYVDAHNTKCG